MARSETVSNIARAVALSCVALLSGCALNASASSEGPVCKTDAKDTVTIDAPASVEIPECTETPIDEPALNKGRRQWCCWQGSAPSLAELQRRER